MNIGKKWMVLLVSVLAFMLCFTGCGNKEESYKDRIDADINQMIAEGKLVDLTVSDDFDKQAQAIIDGSDVEGIFDEDNSENEEKETAETAGGEIPAFVESDGPDTLSDDVYTYEKIGKNIQPGEYVIVADDQENGADYSVVMGDAEHTIVVNGLFLKYSVFNTMNGQYIGYNGGKIYPIDQAPKVQKTADGAYPEGRYKVGVQIPAGDYVVKCDYATITTFSGLVPTEKTAGFCANRKSAIVTVDEGQYIESTDGPLYPIELTADLKPADGVYNDGTYKVGIHMPAGTYKLKADTDHAYAQIYNDGYMVGQGDEIADAAPEATFTVKEGQYVIISGGEAKAE